MSSRRPVTTTGFVEPVEASRRDGSPCAPQYPSRVSVAIPVFNEEENVVPLYETLVKALSEAIKSFEVVLVDDGSKDGTFRRLMEIAEQDERVRVIRLRRNFGQTAALLAGVQYARGDVIVTMDGDLQNDPRDIPLLVEKLEEGYDVVTGWRKNRQDPWFSRKLPSKIANRMIAWVLNTPIHDTGCALKAYRADLLRRIPLYSDLHRYLPAMCLMASNRVAEVVVRHHPRLQGKSKYGLGRTGRVIFDVVTIKMLLSCSRRPLHWFGGMAACFCLLSILAGGIALQTALLPAETASVVPASLCFLFGFLSLNSAIAGLFGELVVRAEPKERVEPLIHEVECFRHQGDHQ